MRKLPGYLLPFSISLGLLSALLIALFIYLRSDINSINYNPFAPDNTNRQLDLKMGANYSSKVRINPVEKTLAVSTRKGLKLFNIPDLTLSTKSAENFSPCQQHLAWSPDGKLLACSTILKSDITVWNVNEQKLLYTLTKHTSTIHSVEFSHDGTLLATADDAIVYLWRIDDGSLVREIKGYKQAVFNADDTLLATVSRASIKIWQVNDGTLIHSLNTNYSGGQVRFSPDGQYLAFGVELKLQVWLASNWNTAYEVKLSKDWVSDIAFSLDSKHLAVSRQASGDIIENQIEDPRIELRDVRSGSIIKRLKGHTSNIWSINFSPDGQYLASSSGDGTIRLWPLR